ncbi:3-hydroxyacyl-thioester dehydratase HtdY [Arthrobacter ginkgonis]|uniref:3-hydroxyacyl-thioester dehydratase HtdY n=1 Tax=Arthrobacter ginkgonis TaxID=1630594 RepID=A0ABP7D875_9MICC
MAVYLEKIGTEWAVGTRQWDSKDALLYALGVGAGAENPLSELEFTTENSGGRPQKVLPTFGVVMGAGGDLARFGDFPLSAILHAEQSLTLKRPIPVEGSVDIVARLSDIQDKGKGAMIFTESDLVDRATGELLLTNTTTIFARGEGGFGGTRTGSTPWQVPERSPDHVVVYRVPEQQALIYRLSGDRNPLHSDPVSARSSGFDRPILHGLCTFGYTGRALLHALCGSDPARFEHMSVRFAASVYPGEELTVRIWEDGDTAKFQTHAGDRLVLDRGEFRRSSR